ncbi:MAG: hypothetical protein V4654_10290 [Bdellovibrionota bacterium]
MKNYILCSVALMIFSCSSIPARYPKSLDAGIFSDAGPKEYFLNGPFDEMFKNVNSFAESEDVESASKVTGDGQISFMDNAKQQTFKTKINVRGNTSLFDCTFKKLKLKLNKDIADQQTPFLMNTTLNLGTHCGDQSDTQRTRVGRLANQNAAVRESFAYQLLKILEVASQETKTIKMTYIDSKTQIQTTRMAFFLEDPDFAARRLGGQKISDEEWDQSMDIESYKKFRYEDVAKAYFAQILIGNKDYGLPLPAFLNGSEPIFFNNESEMSRYNFKIVKWADGTETPMPYDFDLAGMVNDSDSLKKKTFIEPQLALFADGLRPYEMNALFQLQKLRTLFSRKILDQTVQHFVSKKSLLIQVTQAASDLRETDRKIILKYINSFYSLLEKKLYTSVVMSKNTNFYFSEDKSTKCSSKIPIGSPVRVINDSGPLKKVVILDIYKTFVDDEFLETCAGKVGWISAKTLLTSDYPKEP